MVLPELVTLRPVVYVYAEAALSFSLQTLVIVEHVPLLEFKHVADFLL